MPDQYTWHQFRTIRQQNRGPLFAELALIRPFLSGELPGFRPGIRPDLQTPGAPMGRFRLFLHRHFGDLSATP
jgi:hypothetical protein